MLNLQKNFLSIFQDSLSNPMKIVKRERTLTFQEYLYTEELLKIFQGIDRRAIITEAVLDLDLDELGNLTLTELKARWAEDGFRGSLLQAMLDRVEEGGEVPPVLVDLMALYPSIGIFYAAELFRLGEPIPSTLRQAIASEPHYAACYLIGLMEDGVDPKEIPKPILRAIRSCDVEERQILAKYPQLATLFAELPGRRPEPTLGFPTGTGI